MVFNGGNNKDNKRSMSMSSKIYAAFVKAQTAFAPAMKQAKNPHFGSKYAKLEDCIDAVISGLNNNGIGLLQRTHECSDGVMIETIFIHESGEELSGGKLHIPAVKHDAQGYGSALTYARRYSLMAACGHAPEDDDGNAATRPVTPPAAPKLMGVEEVKEIETAASLAGKPVAEICASFKVTELAEIPLERFAGIKKRLNELIDERNAATTTTEKKE